MFLNLQTYSTQYEFSMVVMILLTPGWDSRISFLFCFMQHYIFLGPLLHCGGRNCHGPRADWAARVTVAQATIAPRSSAPLSQTESREGAEPV